MKNRRALSTVVGMVFAIIAFTTTVVYVSYSMNLLSQYNNTVLAKNQALSDVNKERFQITNVAVVNNKINVTLANTGNLPINFTKIWIQNTTTSTIDWDYSYVPTNGFVTPGSTLTNLGQTMPVSVNPSYSYNVKLVTSRGNAQQFSINSPSSTKLNIQFFAFPANIPSATTTELVMVVTNNSTNTLVNVTPNTPTSTGSSTFTYSALAASSPSKYDTLAPGQTIIFKWDLTPTGNNGDSRTFTASLQNGLAANTASTTVSIINLKATSSVWTTTWGILSIDYTSLQWTQDGGTTWNQAWNLPHGPNTVWKISITNNDPSRTFIFNGNSTLVAFGTKSGSNSAVPFYIINNNYPGSGSGCTGSICPYPSNGQTISSGQTGTLFFGSNNVGINTGQNFRDSQIGPYAVSIILFGYWNSVSSNNFFGQNIPYEGMIVT